MTPLPLDIDPAARRHRRRPPRRAFPAGLPPLRASSRPPPRAPLPHALRPTVRPRLPPLPTSHRARIPRRASSRPLNPVCRRPQCPRLRSPRPPHAAAAVCYCCCSMPYSLCRMPSAAAPPASSCAARPRPPAVAPLNRLAAPTPPLLDPPRLRSRRRCPRPPARRTPLAGASLPPRLHPRARCSVPPQLLAGRRPGRLAGAVAIGLPQLRRPVGSARPWACARTNGCWAPVVPVPANAGAR
nr:protein transport protein sec31-like [Aegilops tauschii subsp. strangulata]